MKTYYVYIMASGKNGTLYVGVTSDLVERVYKHKNKLIDGFTKKYKIDKLVYFEQSNSIEEAILREKKIKRWKRIWKIKLIEKDNPDRDDLYKTII